jgi:hypothetical protein
MLCGLPGNIITILALYRCKKVNGGGRTKVGGGRGKGGCGSMMKIKREFKAVEEDGLKGFFTRSSHSKLCFCG